MAFGSRSLALVRGPTMTSKWSQKQISSQTRISGLGVSGLGRAFDKHIDNKELNALVPSSSEGAQELHGLSLDAVREAERHVRLCADCSQKVSNYRQLVSRSSNTLVSKAAQPMADCPREEDVDWHEVAAGLWPELR